jgi:TonB family protein
MRTLTLVITAFLYGCRTGVPVPSSPPERTTARTAIDTVAGVGRVYLETEVDTPAMALSGRVGPRYPSALKSLGREGRVRIQVVVDTTGSVEDTTARVLFSTHPDFAAAVLAFLPQLRFTPAVLGGRRVRMWAIQEFEFRLGAL